MDASLLKEKLGRLKKLNYIESAPIELPDGTKVIFSTLNTAEETLIAEYINGFERIHFLQVTKLENLAHAIKMIQLAGDPDQLDLRDTNVKYPTGEQIDGKDVFVEKHVFVRKLIQTWPDTVNDYLYRKFLELTGELEDKVAAKIKIERSDEYRRQRIESRAAELHALIEETVQYGQEDVPMVFDFTPQKLKDKQAKQPSEAEQKAREQTEEIRKQLQERLASSRGTARRTLSYEEEQKALRDKMNGNLPDNYADLPEAEKQLIREMAEETPAAAAAMVNEKRIKNNEEIPQPLNNPITGKI